MNDLIDPEAKARLYRENAEKVYFEDLGKNGGGFVSPPRNIIHLKHMLRNIMLRIIIKK